MTKRGYTDEGNRLLLAERQSPADHLTLAAEASLGSDVERYHLQAAIAEALSQIAERLNRSHL